MLRDFGEVSFGLSPSSALPARPSLVRLASPDSLAAPSKQNLLPTPLVDHVPVSPLNSLLTLPSWIASVLPKFAFTPSNMSPLHRHAAQYFVASRRHRNVHATFISTGWPSRRFELRWARYCTCFSRLIPWPMLTLPVGCSRTRGTTHNV